MAYLLNSSDLNLWYKMYTVISHHLLKDCLLEHYPWAHPPSQEQFCYYCDNISNNCGYVLIYGHAYHQECFTKLESKYIYCYEYLPLSIDELTRSFNERLQMESENEFDSPSADDIYST
ncbi:hypothetical protein GLOIN_2v1777062 [Rhizophagus irregularis DAOM 181602=DAOM 197198]|uniref:Uncharacterized protein n=1 Tax=Rhizophagus irregularis (strain DAOM 197198w) TaxID=1432141 RepID=A0A015LCW6_RHIIW|nr:hypothetical protein RirG_087880 [Rhizophagus irregularis DAOM 197198w]GET62224.1 hypothetical protein GLOIN_2v1777062 [Rhizophagus irregularis DAOM 181602=DAOM 197198]